MKRLLVLAACLVLLLQAGTTAASAAKPTKPPASAPVDWMGHSWWPRSVGGAPGPSGLWSPANATVDADGRVHLRITRDRKGRLVQGELDTINQGWGYGTYRWEVASDLTAMHPEVVLGLFTYGADPAYGHREIDIEASGWGTTPITWDYTTWANGHNPVARTPVVPGHSTHQFEWAPDHITWTSWDAAGDLLATRTVTGADVPVPLDESIGMNLWVCGCTSAWKQTPATEVVIDSFTFTPAG